MIFSKSKKEPKKTPEEEYADQVSTLTEKELRDLHKDLKIDHYGNSTAAVINTVSGVGLLSLRSTIRRNKTECMQIDVIEARMKEMGWTPHPNRYRDAVPIALGVAAGTTSGMTFGLINVEKNAKRTKEYVKKKDLFKTKEEVEESSGEDCADDLEEVEVVVVEEGQEDKHAESSPMEPAHTLETNPQPVVPQHSIARKPVAAPTAATTGLKPETAQLENLDIIAPLTKEISTLTPTEPELITIQSPPPPPPPPAEEDPSPATTDPTSNPTTKKDPLFSFSSSFSQMNKKMHNFTMKKDRDVKETTTVSVAEVACDGESPANNNVDEHPAVVVVVG